MNNRILLYCCATSDQIEEKKARLLKKIEGDVEVYCDSSLHSRPALRLLLMDAQSQKGDHVIVNELWELGQSTSGLLKNLEFLMNLGVTVVADQKKVEKEQLEIIRSADKSYQVQSSVEGQQRWLKVNPSNKVGRPRIELSEVMPQILEWSATGHGASKISSLLRVKGIQISPTSIRRKLKALEAQAV